MSKFKDWLLQKFIEWEKQQPRRQTYAAFARFLDIKQSSLSQWMAGNYDPQDKEIIAKLAAKLDDDSIYEILGLPIPDPENPDLNWMANHLNDAQFAEWIKCGLAIKERDQKKYDANH